VTAEGSRYRQANLDGTSRRAERAADLVGGEYDLLVMTSSWDSRCLCLLEVEVRARHGIGVFFENRGRLGLRDLHDPLIHEYLRSSCGSVHEFEKPSEDLDGLWGKLWEATLKAYVDIRRPLNVLLDLSTCPRYYAMGFLAAGLSRGVLASITCFYAEGDYHEERSDNRDEQFTAGRWETCSAPMLTGSADPGNARRYVVSVGFEGPKTYRAVNSDDPDRVVVLFPEPGVDPDYPKRTRRSNQLLFREYGVGEDDIVRAHAGDAIAAWKKLTEAGLARDDENPFYLCCGTKPHSVAMALHALIAERPTVLYAKPVGHKENKITPRGEYWTYRIRDLASPGAGV
jgi:hypothetical protein